MSSSGFLQADGDDEDLSWLLAGLFRSVLLVEESVSRVGCRTAKAAMSFTHIDVTSIFPRLCGPR